MCARVSECVSSRVNARVIVCECVPACVWAFVCGGKSRLGLSVAKHEHAGDSTSTVGMRREFDVGNMIRRDRGIRARN